METYITEEDAHNRAYRHGRASVQRETRIAATAIAVLSLWANSTYNDKVVDQVERQVPGAVVTDTPINGYRIFTPPIFEHGSEHVVDVKLEDGSICRVISTDDRALWGAIPLGPFGVDTPELDTSDCED